MTILKLLSLIQVEKPTQIEGYFQERKVKFYFLNYLQLQKSIITHTDELVFIANIDLAKIKEAVILIICDDKGLITDYNLTYYEIFQKVYKKGKKNE